MNGFNPGWLLAFHPALSTFLGEQVPLQQRYTIRSVLLFQEGKDGGTLLETMGNASQDFFHPLKYFTSSQVAIFEYVRWFSRMQTFFL